MLCLSHFVFRSKTELYCNFEHAAAFKGTCCTPWMTLKETATLLWLTRM